MSTDSAKTPLPFDDEEETLFARDVSGRLIRVRDAERRDYDQLVSVTFHLGANDSLSVKVPKAVPTTDSQGVPLRDKDGSTVPRATTIYDASGQFISDRLMNEYKSLIELFKVNQDGRGQNLVLKYREKYEKPKDRDLLPEQMVTREFIDGLRRDFRSEIPWLAMNVGGTDPEWPQKKVALLERFADMLDEPHPIPVLCHQDHMNPVAVCRVCAVAVARVDRTGKMKAARKLVPACQHRVEQGMHVHFPVSETREGKDCLSSIRMLLMMLMARNLHDDAPHDPLRSTRTLVMKPGQPIGPPMTGVYRNELAALARRFGVGNIGSLLTKTPSRPERRDNSSQVILVDHNNCILCNRCVRACNEVKPFKIIGRTGKGTRAAIGFDLNQPMADSNCVSCGECMVSCPTGALTFKTPVAREFWLEGAAPEVNVSAGELMRTNPLFRDMSYSYLKWNEGSWSRRVLKDGEILCQQGDYGATAFILEKGKFELLVGDKIVGTRPAEDLILGEMACINNQPRSATIRARGPSQVLEIRRNILYNLQRNRIARELLDQVYRRRALESLFRKGKLFQGLTEEQNRFCSEFLRDRVDMLHVSEGETICRQGEEGDACYVVRVGHVKVIREHEQHSVVVDYLRPGAYFGEISLLSDLPEVRKRLPKGVGVYQRTATCVALDNVEVCRIRRKDFLDLITKKPEIRQPLIDHAVGILSTDIVRMRAYDVPLKDFVDQGIYQGQKLLVLDLESCTRCDECTKACVHSHEDGHNRLTREGLRFGNFLVATSCRSCHDPKCLVGCPVDAIHRSSETGSLAIRIDNHCIGCGLCSHNCPFGNIKMSDPDGNGPIKAKAVTCDLCESVSGAPGPMCVHACPHDAAHRPSADQFWQMVYGRGIESAAQAEPTVEV